MAMEERQTKIREGAGLQESRLNTEFIDMMRKWGPHFVTGLAVIAGLYFGYTKWEIRRGEQKDDAFVQLNEAAKSASPAGLEGVAHDHAGSAVALEATSYAADLHMAASRTGIPAGEKLDEKDPSKLADATKHFLNDDEKKKELAEAERLYQIVVSEADSSGGQQLLAIGSLNGLASVSEDRGELPKAKEYYQQAMAKAASLKFTKLQELIKKRHDAVDTLKDPPKLFAAADLPGGKDPTPSTLPMGGFTATTSTGEKIQLGGGPGTSSPVTIPGAPAVGTPPTPVPAPSTPPAAPGSPGDPSKPGTTP